MEERNAVSKRIAIVGAGPIGLEAALFAAHAAFDVKVFERGRVADNILDWGHVRLFSPFGLNTSKLGRKAVANSSNELTFPNDTALLTGREFAESYLIPLSQLPELVDKIHQHVEVRSISRSRTWKNELIGQEARSHDSFRLLLYDAGRRHERYAEADYVLDCSGTYGNHNWIGAGGMPCIGETSALTNDDYRLAEISSSNRPSKFSGQRTLVIGTGYSAATSVVALAKLAESAKGTQVVWLTRRERTPPILRIKNDFLPERGRLTDAANQLAMDPDSPVRWLPGRLVRQIERRPDGKGFKVHVQNTVSHSRIQATYPSDERLIVDHVFANVGYRPDRQLYEELQVHECYATGGPIKLAAALLSETSPDCLEQKSRGVQTLRNPEPGFFILGSKSYGRDSRFLLKTGFEQIREAFTLIAGNEREIRLTLMTESP